MYRQSPRVGDRVRVHREDHVLAELEVDALADLRVLDHRHADRVARHVAEVVAALGEALRDGAVHVVAGRADDAAPSASPRSTRRRPPAAASCDPRAARPSCRRRGRPRPSGRPGPATSSDGSMKSVRISPMRAILNSGSARPSRPSRQHHVHQVPAAALRDEVALGCRHHLGGRLARRVVLEEDLEAALVDAHRVAHRLELGRALDGARVVELDVEVDEVEALEGAVVAHGHDVVEAVHADALPAGGLRALRDLLARACPRRPARSRPCRARRRSAPRSGRR